MRFSSRESVVWPEYQRVDGEPRGKFFVNVVFDGREHGGIDSQGFLIVDVFVTECDGEDALCDEVALLMAGVSGIAGIVDECVDALGESDFLIDTLQQDGSGVGGEFAAVEIDGDGFDFRWPGCLGCPGCRMGGDRCQVGGGHGTLC